MAKIYEQLPVVHQTTAVKNFFESTVEQLFAEANSEIITGFIGKKTSDDHNVNISFLKEPTIDRSFYNLSPVINTLNLTSGDSEDFIFFDEAVNTLKIYGANTINQNKVFSSDFKTFLPPINTDKFLNYQEYYWNPETTANCHTVASWTAGNSYVTHDVIKYGTDYYIANRDFTSGSSFVNDATLDAYSFSPDITQSSPAILTTNQDHNFYSGDKIVITGVSGMTEVNNQTYYIEKVTSRTFKLFTDKDLRNPLDTTNFTAWTSGGKITHSSGPSAIDINPSSENYIDIERDIIGKKSYTPAGGKAFRNGMVVKFIEPYVISSTTTVGQKYIVEGVGSGIRLVGMSSSKSAPYTYNTSKDYIHLERGSTNNNIWSKNNFWWHKQNFLDAGDRIPNSEKRALRPILEYDAHIELYNHGTTYKGNVDISVSDLTFIQAQNLAPDQLVDGIKLVNGLTCIFPNESVEISQEIYEITVSGSNLTFSAIPSRKLAVGDIVSVHKGTSQIGLEYYYTTTGLKLAQTKSNRSTPPLFNLYKDDKTYLGDSSLYPLNNFEGNKLFAHKIGTGVNDLEYGFPLSYKSFKSASEIEYQNFGLTENYEFTAIGSTTPTEQKGYYYYKLNKSIPEYHTLFKDTNKKSTQSIDTHFELSSIDIDNETVLYFCGAVPNVDTNNHSGYDILVKVNGINNTDFTYNGDGFIKFNTFNFVKGTLIDIFVKSDNGLIAENSISKHSIPLSWKSNPLNKEISTISEPEYLEHFAKYMKNQTGFTGNVLADNNFTETSKQSEYATDIVQPLQDTLLGVFLLHNKPHNLVDSIRFNAREYAKYRKRFLNELNNYFNSYDVTDLSNEFVLEKVLRNVISFSVGRKVFNQTYLLPFGDNYVEESFTVADTTVVDYTATNYYDLDKIENSLLVYKDRNNQRTLLCVDKDYTITSYNPITVSILNSDDFNTGDTITFKFYNTDRDSAQCPPTPSAMGLYPLYQPAKEIDSSFQTPQTLIVGHDGSRTALLGDRRDDIILEFENRLYNSAKAEFRNANGLGLYSQVNVKPGYFRQTDYENNDWHDLLNLNFANWSSENNVDPITNDFYDLTNEFTWNYRGTSDVPGHWRGWYEYYYDTVRPHTHPWEMLGFTEKPTWWDSTYITATYTDYSSSNSPMWNDIEQGKIISGSRENLTNDTYKLAEFNPFRRIGLLDVLPVNTEGQLKSPYDIATTGSTTLTPTFTNTIEDTTQGYVTTSFRSLDGLTINYNSANVYVESENILTHNVSIADNSIDYTDAKQQKLRYSIPRKNLNILTESDTAQSQGAIGVLNNGLPIYNIQDANTYGDSDYHYNRVELTNSAFALGNTTNDGVQYYHTINADVVGESAWGNATTHSGIVGWAFDGLPIYGPYGYAGLGTNGEITDNTITNIKSCFDLKGTASRHTAIGGAHTGEFVEDFTFNSGLASLKGYVGNNGNGKYNIRYGKTPESPNTAIYYYVCTQDDNGNPMFPYHIGGGTKFFSNDTINPNSENMTYDNKFFSTPNAGNNNNQGNFDSTATVALQSLFAEVQTTTNNISDSWKLGDGAPVENAWKYSVSYPFAVVEALLIAKPGLFATVFSDPTKIVITDIDKRHPVSTLTRKKWLFTDSNDFNIHGDIDSDGNSITNIGYTQFIHSWLNFQGLNSSENFAQKLRTLNIKLGHRFAGFVDKDTMRLTLDQYSATGSSTNLILPDDNITVDIHDSGYKTRNYYSGVIVEKTADGWKVRGYDKKLGYFETLQLDTNGPTESVQVGGNTVSHSTWTANVSYSNNSYIIHNGAYYKAKSDVPSSDTFNIVFWQSISSLPQEDTASATYYQKSTDIVERVYYETEYTSTQSLFNFLIALGRYQERAGYDLSTYDVSIGDTRNWLFGAKQYLFWTTGSWQVGNTIELSPLAGKLKFTPPNGFVAKVNRSERDMFSIMDQTGKAIEPTECDILREGTSIEITPPTGSEIYGIVLYSKEIEHAMVIDNVTDFADTVNDPIINQRQNRIKIKATRTLNWDGKLTTNGFIVNGDELIPNLDNLAQTMGRYTEQGFVPVERDVYEASRRLYGYQERSYLNELDITDDQQFDFYKGMIQNKGTGTSLSRIARSSKIVQGDMNVYDEWAIKVGDFGDVANHQSIELKIDRANVVQDPQLISLAFPQDTTGTVSRIDVINSKHRYFELPTITINNPTTGSNVATAEAILNSNGELSGVNITNAGTGYEAGTGLIIETANIVTNDTSQLFRKTDAMSSAYVTFKEYDYYNNTLLSNENSNITGLGSLTITDHFGNTSLGTDAVTYNLGSITDIANIATLINTNADMNSNITASIITENVVSNTDVNANVVTWYANTLYQANSLIRYEADTTAGGFEYGKIYVIKTLGNTDFTAIGGNQVDAGNIVGNTSYIINSTGTSNFTNAGATNNNVGTIFTANASFLVNATISGNGTVIETTFTANAAGIGTGTASNTEILTANLDVAYENLFTPSTNASFTTGATFNSNLYFTTPMGSLVVGQQYVIDTTNDTDFTKLGASANTAGTIFTATSTGNITAGNFVIDSVYVIDTVQANANVTATDFTTIGATNNNPGTVFTATGVGTGTGTAFLGSGTVHQGKGNLEVKPGAFITSGGFTTPVYRDVNYLKIEGDDFTLSDNDSNATLGKLQLGATQRYQPRQRYKVTTANNTVKANIVVSVANTIVPSSNYEYDAGDRWQISPLANTTTGSITFDLGWKSPPETGTVTNLINGSTSFDTTNYTTIDNNDYAFIDVYVDGDYIENEGDIIYYTVTSNTITFANVEILPKKAITRNSNVYIIEHSTIDFVDAFKGDIPGATLNIKATTNDDITAMVTPVRNYEITPDAKDDEIILLDIDDTSKFLKKPTGLRSDELWKTTSNVSALGITDSKFNPLPNAGYVNTSNVTYSAFNVPSIAQLFGDNVVFKPEANDTIHIAKAENQDWNVYKLTDTNSTLSFVEQDNTTETAYLYMNDVDLFSYVDNNAIGGDDNNRYLDYHLVIKDADLTDQFVVWTNQQVVDKKGVKITDFAGANMTAANITDIGPANVMPISNVEPATSDSAVAVANVEIKTATLTSNVSATHTTINVGSTSGLTEGMILSVQGTVLGNISKIATVHDSTTLTLTKAFGVALTSGTEINFTTGLATITTSMYNLADGDVIGFREGQPEQKLMNVIGLNHYSNTETLIFSISNNTVTMSLSEALTLQDVFYSGNLNPIPIHDIEADQYAELPAGNIVANVEYSINSLGNTDFNLPANTSGVTYAVGDIFTATTAGTGTGQVVKTTATEYIGNNNSLTIPTSYLSANGEAIDVRKTDLTKLWVTVSGNLQSYGPANMVHIGSSVEVISTNSDYNGRVYPVCDIDPSGTAIAIQSDDFPLDSNASIYYDKIDTAIMGVTGFKYNNHSNLHTKDYTISNVTSAGFTVYDANVTSNISADILSIAYYGKTKITANTVDHNLAQGDVVKLIANAYSGYYYIESATEDSFVISQPYNANVSKTGSIIKPGMVIHTDKDHGISEEYIGKRIAVHMAEPDYYNKVYTVTGVTTGTSNTITIADAFSFADVANAQFTAWAPNTSFTKGERILNGVVTYVAANAFTSGSTFESDNLNVGKPALLTTVDHNKIKLNNTEIVLGDIKSEEDVVDSINHAMALRRGAVDNDHTQISFAMITGKNNNKLTPILSDYRQVDGYSPYVNADNVQNTPLGDGLTKAGDLNYRINKKGFVNDPNNPDFPTNLTDAVGNDPATILNTGTKNPFYLGDKNNYGVPTDPTKVPLFNFPDENGTPVPGAGIDSGAKPIIDPRKAVANISKKPCVDMCSPIHIPPTPVVPVTGGVVSPPVMTTTCFGGSLVDSAGNPGVYSVSGKGHGDRRFGGNWSGHYVLKGTNAGYVHQIGGSRGGLSARGLAGVMTWSDNGSTMNFNMKLKFSKAGTFYAHVYNAGRSGYNDRTYVQINNVTNGTTNIGRQNSVHTGKGFSFNGPGGVKAFTVSAGDIIQFKGTCRGGGNHWHGLAMHISTSSSGLDTCTKSQQPGPGATSGYANLPVSQNYSNLNVTFHEQHNRSSNQEDNNYYTLKGNGVIEILFDMYSGADRLEVFQGVSKGGESKRLGGTMDQGSVTKLTDAEKQEILTKAGQPSNNGTYYGGSKIRDFTHSGQNVRNGGKLSVAVDIKDGTYLKVKINKPSIVYRYVIKLPDTPPKPPEPKSNPAPGQSCNVAIYNPQTPTPSTGVQTPIYSPGGNQTTTKKNTGTSVGGVGGGYGGGAGSAGGGGYSSYGSQSNMMYNVVQYYQNLGKYGGGSPKQTGNSHHFSANYGGMGLAPMAGFSMIPDIFKKTVKVTASNSYGKYQPLTGSQFVNNTVQRVTGGKILPLAQPLRNVAPSKPGKLRALDISNYPFWNELTYTGDNYYKKGNTFFTYTPGKIGTDIRLQDGTVIGNVLDDFNLSGGIPASDVVLNYPGQIPNVLPNPDSGSIALEPGYVLPPEDSPYESNVTYSESPVVGITPKIKDKNGNYIPAGPTVYCDLSRPTPGHTIALDDMTGITPGDELIINNTKIKFPGSDTKVVEKALRCTQGSGFMVHDTFKNGKPALRVSSCSNAPLTIRDGCAGGIYKEVLDFHVVRGFEQSETETSNTAVLPATTGYGYTNANVGVDARAGSSQMYTLYNASGTITDYTGPGRNVSSPDMDNGKILSSKTVSKTTGGSGYGVGDRLRIVGGLPIENPYGGITEFCIDMPGMNYTSAENVKVYIGDGTTPGSGAKAGAVILNENGGIASIEIISGGEGYDFARPPKVKILDLGEGATQNGVPAEVSVKIGTGRGLPPRVAKFIVSSVDAKGTITSLQVIDRGIYKQFPADLTQGVPLEYDAVGLGDESGVDANGVFFQGTGLGQFDPLDDNKRLESPGGYDPLNGLVGGGTGARVFLTAREIPDCSEKGDAKSKLGFPDQVIDINIPEDIAACLNNALFDAGYDPDKIHIDTENVNDLIDLLKFRTPGYDGIAIDELTPGFLEKLGIPPGDYNIDSLCIDAVLETPNSPIRRANKIESGTNLLDDNRFQVATIPDSPVISINCIDTIGNGYGSNGSPGDLDSGVGRNGQDPNSILGDANVVFTTDMFQYELRTTSGEPVNTLNLQQECSVLYLESARYSKNNGNLVVKDGVNVNLDTLSNVWIDNYNDSGWAYLESNVAKATQPNLVDTTFVDNAIIYDQETGEKEYDLHFYDPFKGVIPGFIQKEIAFTGPSDPVVYNNARTGFGRKDIGKVWWNTSTIAYKWYEQGTNRDRWLNWGQAFPGSGITLFEWVEDIVPPVNYNGTGTPKNNSEFVLERRINPVNGRYTNYYYFWVQNKTDLENIAIEELGREYDTFTLAKYLADPIGAGLPLISFVSDKAMVLSNIAPLLREDEQNLQINFSRNLNPVGQKHTAWKLLRQDDNNSIIPEDLSDKLIDSLTGTDALGQSVPDPLLSEVEAYGVKFRPRQSMFKDLKGARQVLHYTLNEILADLQLSTNYPDWDKDLPASRTYIETINWYGTQYIDAGTNKKVRYDATFKPIYKVNSVQELDTLQNIPDNTIVQVKGPNSEYYSLHKYISATKTFDLISIQNDNVRLGTSVYTDNTNITLSSELRLLLVALRDNVFAGTNLWNKLFFALMKYAYTEQKQLDWAFKTSYVFVEKEEEDLIEINGFKVDNFDKVLQYFDEVKPYTAKVREYKDGKSPIREKIGTNAVSDFDKPPYADPVTGNVRILDDFLQADSNIIQTNNAYTNYFSVSNKSLDPVRHSNTTIKFDRVDYQLLPHDYQPAVNVATWTANATYPRNSYVYVESTNKYYKANIDIAGASNFSSANWTELRDTNNASTIMAVPVADTANSAIARNIVTLTVQSNAQVQSNTLIGASERAFKFNPSIQSQFLTDIFNNFTEWQANTTIVVDKINESRFGYIRNGNDLYSIDNGTTPMLDGNEDDIIGNTFTTSTSFTNDVSNFTKISSPYELITGNVTEINYAINNGSLNNTLALVKTAAGGDFQGEVTDANLFTRSFGVDTNTFQSQIGFNRTGWNTEKLDVQVDVKNYQGVFNTAIAGNEVSFERDGTVYEGFDGVTFKRVLYGEERPQELIMVEPLETLIFRVTSHKHLKGNTSLSSASANSSTVKYQITSNIYGDTEFIRIKQDGSTTTTTSANLYTYSDEITVANASVLAKPLARIPGIIWVGSERIEYTKRNTNTNKLTGLTRGTNGTSIQDWVSGTEVINANSSEQFNDYPTSGNVWLDNGAVSLADLGNANVTDSSSIMRFLHGRE